MLVGFSATTVISVGYGDYLEIANMQVRVDQHIYITKHTYVRNTRFFKLLNW